ncbi:conserved hypothetical protein, membrane [Salinibacter ruber M8]|uniref:Uncharacterized protein n=1 Tax=Salinibacter ruber (strain M8) TaxID=761659 RepID=D5HA91_SALRM|nr:DUF4175 family protein [Salinibacter ruber]CBH24946.1 conserved hypothetical protein, membrane [Salinibacter ruber M8]
MSEQTARLVERLRTRLRRATRRMSWAQLAFGGALAGGTAAALWLLAATLEAALWLQTSLRTGLLLLAGAVLLGIGAAFVARPVGRLLGLLDGPSEKDVARTVGEHHPVVADRLVNLLQLAEGQRSHAPAPYVDQAVQHLADHVDEVQFDEVADFQPARRAARWALFPALAVLTFLLAAPSTFLDASERLLAPRTEFERPAPFQFDVRPGDAQLVRGDSLRVTVRATGTVPETATLLLRPAENESPRRVAIEADSMGTYRHTVPNVRRPLRYRVAASPVRTEWYTVEVARRPVVRRLQLRVSPPAYTDRPARELAPNVGAVTALPGTEVTVSAALGGAPVTNATLDFENGPAQSLTVTDDSATGRFRLRREDTYALRLESAGGIPNRDPIRYEVDLQTDARPSVSFLNPGDPTELTPDLTQPLRVQLSDDYGFRRAALFYRRTDGGGADSSFSSIDLPLPDGRAADQVLSHTWLLAQESGLDLERGDEVAYYVKAWDNDTVNGPKGGRTATQRLRFPSLSEQYEELDTLQRETGEQMQELNRRSKDVQQQFQDLRREVRRTREADWEDQRQLERLQQKQQSLSQSKSSLSRQVDSLNREMQRNDLSSPETSKKFQELKQTIDEMESKDLQKALENMRQSMQDQSFRQMQSAMEQAQSRLEQQEQQLERTLNLFKQLKARQKMEELSRRAEDIRKREDQVAQETSERMDASSDADSTGQSQEDAPSSESPSSDSTAPPTTASDSSRADASPPGASDSTGTAPSDSLGSQRSPRADSSANPDLAREQKELAKEMETLMEEMQDAQQDMKDVPSAPKKDLQQMRKQMRKQDLPEQMRQNSQQLRKNQLRKARQQQRRLQKRLQSMQSRMSQMQQQMKGQQRRMNMTGLRSALANTLRLSNDQEGLRTTLEGLEGEGSAVRRFAPQQKELQDGLNHVADSLQSIANRLPRMSKAVQEKTGNALRAMEDATTALDAREGDEATGYQKTSMMHLNELARLLSDLLDQMKQQQSSGGSGKMSMQQAMQQLQQTSGQQQKLNQQIQKFLNKAQGERLSKDMQARRKQLAKQQRQIKQQLDEMNMEEEAKQKLMGDLQKIADQMEQSADDLRSGRHSRDLINRQQQILSRLLNAQQSLRTQGKKQKRRGRQADDDFDRQRPGNRPDSEAPDTLRRGLIRALEMGYDSEYEALIKKYFELLEQREGAAK